MEKGDGFLKSIFGFTTEEKILSFIPLLYAYCDYIMTLYVSGTASVLWIQEQNISFKLAVWDYGVYGLFGWIVFMQCVIFLLTVAIICAFKKYNIDIKYVYAVVFFYGGYRASGMVTWLV